MWPAWRLVLEHVATWVELETVWSIDDVVDANEVLDAYNEAKAESMPKPEPAPGGRRR